MHHLQTPAFPRFPDLPVELQCSIWELALQSPSSDFIWAEWPGPEVALLAPLIDLRDEEAQDTSEDKKPGLIPYAIPEGLPQTMDRFPLPYGLPVPHTVGIDIDSYAENMTRQPVRMTAMQRVAEIAAGALQRVTGRDNRQGELLNCIEYNAGLALLSVCRLSRKTALRHAIVKTHRTMPMDAPHGSSSPQFFEQRHGVVMRHILTNQQKREGHCFAYILGGADPSGDSLARPPRLGKIPSKPFPLPYTHVAMRLGDIERCIFGRRLAFSEQAAGEIDQKCFDMAEWTMWWRPELGARARRPEANHPFHCTPMTIIAIYAAMLHSLEESFLPTRTVCQQDYTTASECYRWYSRVAVDGNCPACSKPIFHGVRRSFPETIDDAGHIDVVVLMDRNIFEYPEGTVDMRAHEF